MTNNRTIINETASIYGILNHLSDLYEKSLHFEFIDERTQLWNKNIKSITTSIEIYFDLWDIINLEVQFGVPSDPSSEKYEQIKKIEDRLAIVSKSIKPWTNLNKIPKFILYFEHKLQQIFHSFVSDYPSDWNEIKLILQEGFERVNNLEKINKSIKNQISEINRLPNNLFV